ncbi:hypothetical protein DAPPUDRAFT_114200 [Daphnia pulex]|uniref:DDE-1 domain-containing protein n=1 Tax=Daphnia pulex TaxID=6669 RepID=E9HHD0_DAPPU|nr:hypothetical protein DAPPUDRAFT_114200 [Daphnia pulex]|eukprot:EFX68864.1 hypothetical protein DAPPUDRAFT_114200 [Daphnia pulex]
MQQTVSAERGVNVTMLAFVNAAGGCVPPVFVFPRKQVYPSLFEGPLGCLGLEHESGWKTGQNFYASLVHFHSFVKSSKEKPVLLIMDNGIVLLTLPPHCSHVLQPLDVTVFGSFKKAIGECQNDWLFQNPGGQISIKDIAALSRRPYQHTFTPDKIIRDFVTTGICQFSRFAIPDARYGPSFVTNRPAPTDDAVSSTPPPDSAIALPIDSGTEAIPVDAGTTAVLNN